MKKINYQMIILLLICLLFICFGYIFKSIDFFSTVFIELTMVILTLSGAYSIYIYQRKDYLLGLKENQKSMLHNLLSELDHNMEFPNLYLNAFKLMLRKDFEKDDLIKKIIQKNNLNEEQSPRKIIELIDLIIRNETKEYSLKYYLKKENVFQILRRRPILTKNIEMDSLNQCISNINFSFFKKTNLQRELNALKHITDVYRVNTNITLYGLQDYDKNFSKEVTINAVLCNYMYAEEFKSRIISTTKKILKINPIINLEDYIRLKDEF